MGMIRNALSDPLTAIGSVINILLKPCTPIPYCLPDGTSSIRWKDNELTCRAIQFASLLGEVVGDVMGIIEDFGQVSKDYCSRLEEDEDKDED